MLAPRCVYIVGFGIGVGTDGSGIGVDIVGNGIGVKVGTGCGVTGGFGEGDGLALGVGVVCALARWVVEPAAKIVMRAARTAIATKLCVMNRMRILYPAAAA